MEVLGDRRFLVAVTLTALAGCDAVFGLERDPPPELEGYDRCGAFLYDEPLRYATVMNPNTMDDGTGALAVAPWSWDEARTACQLRGMDLAVFNDEHELGRGAENAIWPYWIGQRTVGAAEETVDGCPAVTAPVAQRFVAADATACGIVAGALEIDGASCDGTLPETMESPVVLSALCETPRPDTVECLGQDPTRTKYLVSEGPMSYADAKSYCRQRDARLVVVETGEEWRFLAQQTRDTWKVPFWIGATLDGTQWRTENGCIGLYSWSGGTPGTPGSGSCMAGTLLKHTGEDVDPASAILEGVTPTACDDTQSYALCEID